MAGIAYSASSYINCYNKGYIKSKSGCAGISYSPGGDVNNTFNMGILEAENSSKGHIINANGTFDYVKNSYYPENTSVYSVESGTALPLNYMKSSEFTTQLNNNLINITTSYELSSWKFNGEYSTLENVGVNYQCVDVDESKYEIQNASQLRQFASDLNAGRITGKVTVSLKNDIDLGNQEFTPIGTTENPFNGTFNGNGHVIKNLYISNAVSGTQNYVGLFGVVGSGSINRLGVTGNINTNSTSSYVGGLVGEAKVQSGDTLIINKCYSEVEINASSFAGGLIGFCESGQVIICNSFNSGNIRGGSSVSGIVGGRNTNANVKIVNSYNSGNISGSYATINGIGSANTIINCINTGTLTIEQGTGAIYGISTNGTVSNSYYLKGDNYSSSQKGIEKNAEQMKSKEFWNTLNENRKIVDSSIDLKTWKYNAGSYPTLGLTEYGFKNDEYLQILNKSVKKIEIIKEDEETGEKLTGAEFKFETLKDVDEYDNIYAHFNDETIYGNYNFTKEGEIYKSNGAQSYSAYLKIDLTGYNEQYQLKYNAKLEGNSRARAYIYLSTNNGTDHTNRKSYLSGNSSTTQTIDLTPNSVNYFIWSGSNGGIFSVSNIELLCNGNNVEFLDYVYSSKISGTSTKPYITINLDENGGKRYLLEVEASINSKENANYGYAAVTNSDDPELSEEEKQNGLIYISGNVESRNYTQELEGGTTHYLHIGNTINDSSTTANEEFKITSIKLKEIKEKTLTTNAEGKISYSVPQGDLVRITETKALNDYMSPNYTKTITADENVQLTVKNKKNTLFTINKVDEETGEPISGVKFAIYKVNASQEVIEQAKYGNGNYVGTLEDGVYVVTTDQNGKINLNLPEGYYKAVEVQTAYGYALEEDENLRTLYFKVKAPTETNSSNIYEINYIEDLVKLSNDVNSGINYEGITVKLMKDLDFASDSSYKNSEDITTFNDYNGDDTIESIKTELTKGRGFLPIGYNGGVFKGDFDGNGKKISNLYINGTHNYYGLFGQVENSSINNLIIEKANLNTSGGYTGLIGYATNSSINNVIIEKANLNISSGNAGLIGYATNSSISNITITQDNTIKLNGGTVGMIVGYAKDSSITECTNAAKIDFSAAIGGIAGQIYNTQVIDCNNSGEFTENALFGGSIVFLMNEGSIMQNCHNTGTIRYSGGPTTGGLVYTASNSKIINCSNEGDIISSAVVAGIVGTLKEQSIMVNCYNKGSIKCAGTVTGICNSINNSRIINCYNAGNITSINAPVAGIVFSGTGTYEIANCYNSGTITTESASANTYSLAYSANTSYFKNCYYLEGTAQYAVGNASENLAGNYEKVSEDKLKSELFVEQLNQNRITLQSSVNIPLYNWSLNDEPTLVSNGFIKDNTVTITNNKIPERQLKITKIDKDTLEQLSGAEIKLEKVEGTEENEKYITVGTYTSSATEPITENIYSTYKYRITETKAPKGYASSSDPVIIEAGTETAEIVIENEKIPTFSVKVHHYLEGTQGNEPVKLQEDQTATLNNGDYYVIFSKEKDKTEYQDDYYEIKPSEELLGKYELVSTVTQNEAEGNALEDIEVTYYYQIKEHIVTTKVEIPEGRTEKGGIISGDNTIEGNEEYETVNHNENSTKDIEITPSEGYRVKEIRLVSTTSTGNKTETTIYGENSEPTSEVKARMRQDGSMILTKFVEMTEDKEVIVVFEPDEGTVIVHHYIENTTQKIHKDEITKDTVGKVVETNPVEHETYILVEEPEDKNPEIKTETQERTYYYNVAYKITTDVIEHEEGEDDHKVKGGSISGEDENAYEIVARGRNNKQEIVMKPDAGYEIVHVKINGEDVNIEEFKDDYGTVTLPQDYFTNVQKDIHVEVEYRKATRIIVKYLEEETENVLYQTESGKDQIVILGHDGDEFTTEHKIIPGYIDSSLGITDTTKQSIDTHNGVEIVENSAQGTMKEDELEIIYWYKKVQSGVVVRHIEINEKGETTELDNEVKETTQLSEVSTERNEYTGYISVNGEIAPSENITIVASNNNSQSVEQDSNVVKEVWYYYEKQFKVTTEVNPHIEIDENENEVQVDGGTISKEYKTDSQGELILDENGKPIEIPYEEILNRADSTKEIKITPADTYRVKSITINEKEISFEQLKVEDSEEVVLSEKYFEDVQEDKHVVVEFEKIPATVIVKYLDVTTGEEVLEDKVIEGALKDSYDEARVDVEGYLPAEPEPSNSKGEMTRETITIIYYYTKEFKITTDVKEHEEPKDKTVIDVLIQKIDEKIEEAEGSASGSEEVKVKVKGGSITGELTDENNEPVEKVLRGNDNTNEIEMNPDENYRIKSVTIYEGEKNENGEYTGKSYEIDIDELINDDGTVVIPEKYFTNMQSDKHIVVEYEKIPSKVIVNYKEKSTEEDVAEQLIGHGHVGDEYITHEQEIPYYELLKDELPENAEGVLVEEDTVVNYWYRRFLFNMKITKEFTSIQVNGKETLGDDKSFAKVDIKDTDLSKTNITVKYKVTVTNTEEIAGTAVIAEQIPVGFKFVNAEAEGWTLTDGKYLKTTKTLEPDETEEYEIILEWDTKTKLIGNLENIARIAETQNTPEFEETTLEDNQDSCMLIISIRTGEDRTIRKVISITFFVLAGMLTVYYIASEVYFRRKK